MTDSRIAVYTEGVASSVSPPVILVHGFASSGTEDYLATGWPAALSDAGRISHVIDLPGHGASRVVTSVAEGTTTSIVADLMDVIDDALAASRLPAVDVIAYSLGSRLAWELPAASGGRVRRLVLGGLSPFEPFADVELDALRASALDGAEPTSPLVGMMAAMISAPERDTASLLNLIGGLASQPFAPQSSAPGVPVLFVAGAADVMSNGIAGLADATPGGRLVRVPGDHRGALDSAEFRSAAIDFIA